MISASLNECYEYILGHPGICRYQLERALGRSFSGRMTARLVQAGLIEVRPDPADPHGHNQRQRLYAKAYMG
jgi:hypothetical protein